MVVLAPSKVSEERAAAEEVEAVAEFARLDGLEVAGREGEGCIDALAPAVSQHLGSLCLSVCARRHRCRR